MVAQAHGHGVAQLSGSQWIGWTGWCRPNMVSTTGIQVGCHFYDAARCLRFAKHME